VVKSEPTTPHEKDEDSTRTNFKWMKLQGLQEVDKRNITLKNTRMMERWRRDAMLFFPFQNVFFAKDENFPPNTTHVSNTKKNKKRN